jgi:hypothetical protein
MESAKKTPGPVLPPSLPPKTQPASGAVLSSTPAVCVGDRVKGRYRASSIGKFGTKWYNGIVSRVHPSDGTVSIRYDDGDVEDGVKPQFVKADQAGSAPPTPPPAAWAAAAAKLHGPPPPAAPPPPKPSAKAAPPPAPPVQPHGEMAERASFLLKAGAPVTVNEEEGWLDSGHEWIGASVRRFFAGGMVSDGKVVRWLPAEGDDFALWHMVHEDGDEEDLEEDEVEAAMLAYQQQLAPQLHGAPPAEKPARPQGRPAGRWDSHARAPSAYNAFMSAELKRLKAAQPSMEHREAFRQAAIGWTALPAEERKPWEAVAKAAPPKPPKPPKAPKWTASPSHDTWAQCNRCDKWRRVSTPAESLPEEWYCELSTDPTRNTCDAAEEVEKEVGGYSPMKPVPPMASRPAEVGAAEELFEVEALLEGRGNGKPSARQYLVKWLGYAASHNSWEPRSRLPAGLVAEFEAVNGGGGRANKRKVIPTMVKVGNQFVKRQNMYGMETGERSVFDTEFDGVRDEAFAPKDRPVYNTAAVEARAKGGGGGAAKPAKPVSDGELRRQANNDVLRESAASLGARRARFFASEAARPRIAPFVEPAVLAALDAAAADATETPPRRALLLQPESISGGEMRDYQLAGLDRLADAYERHGLSLILGDEMGLGKTLQVRGRG